MSRASRRDNSNSGSLFPFLAVLLCTMGVLVVLLVVMASVQLDQAERKQLAKQAAAPQVDEAEQEKLRAKMEKLDEAAQKLEQRRRELNEKLGDEQLRLSQIEENIRRYDERLGMLRVEIDELKSLDEGNIDDLEKAKERLAKQQELIAETKKEIERLKRQAEKHTKRYAIVPYEGPNGTRRQPIYVECRRNSVVIQPEGIELTPSDFNRRLGAGGPLPSAIRAAQQYYVDHGLASQKQAYPLVVARPDAIGALSIVQTTLERANMQYGYELVEADCELDYSAADPALSNEIQHAVENARRRMAAKRDSAPTYAHSEVHSFEQGPSPLEQVRKGLLPSMLSPVGGRSGAANSQIVLSNNSIDINRIASVLDSAHAAQTRGGPAPASRQGDNNAPRDPNRYAAADRARAEAAMRSGQPANPSAAQQGNGQHEDASGSEQQPEAQQMAGPTGQPTSSQAQQVAQPGNQQADAPNAAGGAANGNADDLAGQNHSMHAAAGAQGAGRSTKPKNGVALVRTIRVQVEASRLVVRSGKQSVADRSIPLEQGGQHAAGKFVEAIRGEIDGWGWAGQGLYWQPVLEMSVAPGGQQLADQLAAVLRQGGFDVRVAMLPGNTRN